MGERRLAVVEEELTELRTEFDELKAEFHRFRREVRAERLLNTPLQNPPGVEDAPSEDSYSFVTRSDSRDRESRVGYISEVDRPAARNSPTPPSSSQRESGLSWARREEIAKGVGQFFARAVSGRHRGASGRDLNPLPSRIWVVVRDYNGLIYTPVRVFRSWGSCKLLVKKHEDAGDSVFCGFPSEREGKVAIAAAELQWPAVIEQ